MIQIFLYKTYNSLKKILLNKVFKYIFPFLNLEYIKMTNFYCDNISASIMYKMLIISVSTYNKLPSTQIHFNSIKHFKINFNGHQEH